MCIITSRCTRAAAAEEDAVGEQQAAADTGGGAVRSDRTRLVLARDTTAQGRIRVGGYARLTQLLQLLHREELQVPDCSHRQTKGCRGSDRGTSSR